MQFYKKDSLQSQTILNLLKISKAAAGEEEKASINQILNSAYCQLLFLNQIFPINLSSDQDRI